MKYRKKPVVIEAIQWLGNNFNELVFKFPGIKCAQKQDDSLIVESLEGLVCSNIGDYIIKGIEGEFYSCKESVFNKSYEKVVE